MKKICFVTTVSITLKSFILETAKYLHNKGDFDISFICNTDEAFGTSLPEYIHYYPVPMKRGISIGGIKAMLTIKKIFKVQKFDIVQYSTPNASCYASLAGWLQKIPVRLYCQWGIAYVGFTGVKRCIFKLIEKMVCKFSTQIEPDSFGNLDFSHKERLYPKSKGTVIWNGSASGVNLKKFDVTYKEQWRRLVREKYAIPKSAVVYIFVGRITKDKGINELFAASRKLFEKTDNTYLLLIGDNENATSINQELYNWSLDNNRVIYGGFTNVVEQYLSAADVYILPSYREGFGSAVIEAEAMAIPVIVTDIPGPTDAMVEETTGIVVKKGDVASLYYAMKKLYSDSRSREEMGRCAYDFASQKFEQQVLFRKIMEDRIHLLEMS